MLSSRARATKSTRQPSVTLCLVPESTLLMSMDFIVDLASRCGLVSEMIGVASSDTKLRALSALFMRLPLTGVLVQGVHSSVDLRLLADFALASASCRNLFVFAGPLTVGTRREDERPARSL